MNTTHRNLEALTRKFRQGWARTPAQAKALRTAAHVTALSLSLEPTDFSQARAKDCLSIARQLERVAY